MKTNFRPIILSIIILLITSGIYGQDRITVTLQDFTSLSVSGNVRVEIVPSASHKMSVTAKNGMPEEVEYEIKNGELKIRAKANLKQENEIAIKLPYQKLSSIEATTGAVINSQEDLCSRDLYLKALTGGKIELSVKAGMVEVKVSQVSDIILYGETVSQNVLATTGGNYLAYDLECEEAIVKATSGAQIKIKAAKNIEAIANSKGFVAYIGDPESSHTQTSLGGIVQSHKTRPAGE